MNAEIVFVLMFIAFAFTSGVLLLLSRKEYFKSLSMTWVEEINNAQLISSQIRNNLPLTWLRMFLNISVILIGVAILLLSGIIEGLSIIFILVLFNNSLVYLYIFINSIFGVNLCYSRKEFTLITQSYFAQDGENNLLAVQTPRRNAELLFCTFLNIVLVLLCIWSLYEYDAVVATPLNGILWMSQNIAVSSLFDGRILS